MEHGNLTGALLELSRPSRHPNSMSQQCYKRHFCANLFVHGEWTLVALLVKSLCAYGLYSYGFNLSSQAV